MKSVTIFNEHGNTHLRDSNVRGGPMQTATIDLKGLEHDLRTSIRGEVRFDDGSRALYATDGSHYRQVPLGVTVPKDVEDVVTIVSLCHQYKAPIVMRGGGTSLAGQGCNVAVVIDMSKYMHHILALNPAQHQARVQPGIILDHLRKAAERHHLTFGPDPATHDHCTIGGMIGNDSCGVHSVMAGKTVENIDELEILTYDGLRMRVGKTSDEELARIIQEGGRRGEIYSRLKALRDRYADQIRTRYPHIPRRVSGYNLDQLLPEHGFHVARALVGTESTCVIVLEATTRLVYSPPARSLLVLGYPNAYHAADHVPEILESHPVGLEGFDLALVHDMQRKGLHPNDVALLPEGQGWLLVEFGGESKEESDDKAKRLMKSLKRSVAAPSMKLFDNPDQEHKIWEIRESGLGATAFVPGKKTAWTGWEDAAVPPENLGRYLRDFSKLVSKHGYECDLYGHFGQGCVHTRLDFEFDTVEGVKNYRSFVEEAANLVIHYGGSLSGEHGDGQSRAELLPKMFGNELIEAFREFKTIWDPDWKMNPGKVVNAYRLDENLRLGPGYQPMPVQTHFKFPDDQGSFARATTRCVGVGKCRHTSGGTMCPSFMATREEADTTRGRAHLLFEMLEGNPLSDGWRDDAVKESLDLCLACKGCKGDCPVNVDMATYKAEFLSHYYQGRLRSPTAYTMGLIYWWSRLASYMPTLANTITHMPGASRLLKLLGGITQEREIPSFAPQPFTTWFHNRPPRNVGMPQVMLWPDTFNNYFKPETAQAAVEVLEDAGYHVVIPHRSLCCGRPLYDFGMLTLAEHLLQQILETLRPEIRAGIPVVGLEPSCVSVFRDELHNLFPHDEDAKRLTQQSFLLSEFLTQKATHYQIPSLPRKAIVHGHCHHKALMKMDAEKAILEKMGLDFHVLDSGCCGMAGAFGYEDGHYDVSVKIGERVLLPAVRQAEWDTLLITDGFSCRSQIEQLTDRQGLHLAQVLQMALHSAHLPLDEARQLPEEQAASLVSPQLQQPTPLTHAIEVLVTLGAIGLVSTVGLRLWKRLTT